MKKTESLSIRGSLYLYKYSQNPSGLVKHEHTHFRVGFPFAQLKVNQEVITISYVGLWKKKLIDFYPGDILAINVVKHLPYFIQWLEIVHKREDIQERVHFSNFSNLDKLLEKIKLSGFKIQ